MKYLIVNIDMSLLTCSDYCEQFIQIKVDTIAKLTLASISAPAEAELVIALQILATHPTTNPTTH